jgi:L-aspartate oxidase
VTEYDTLIVGSGLAGLCAALLLAPTPAWPAQQTSLDAGASGLAQGGIAAVLDAHDSFDAHVQDTLVAGAGLCDEAATRFIEGAPAAMAWLQAQGVPFTEEDGSLHLTREGGHSARRIAHVADATGAAVQRTLIEVVRRTPASPCWSSTA